MRKNKYTHIYIYMKTFVYMAVKVPYFGPYSNTVNLLALFDLFAVKTTV